MHELAITRGVLESIKSECIKNKVSPKKVFLELGDFAGCGKDSLLFCYDLLRSEYPMLKGAELVVSEIESRIACNTCGKESVLQGRSIAICPSCDSSHVALVQGKDIRISRIE